MKKPIAILASMMLISLCACGTEEPIAMTEDTEAVTEVLLLETETETETEEETETESETEIEQESEAAFEEYIRYTNTDANIRNLPTAEGSEVLRTVPVNTEVTVVNIKDDWSQIKTGDGTEEYIKTSLLSESKVEQVVASGSGKSNSGSESTGAKTGSGGSSGASSATPVAPAPAPVAPAPVAEPGFESFDSSAMPETPVDLSNWGNDGYAEFN